MRWKTLEVFKDYAYYYNSFYKSKNYLLEASQVDSILKKYNRDISTIINFGCGTYDRYSKRKL